MSEELIIAQCSPTMAGLKTGNLFSCPLEDKKDLFESLRKLNAMFVPRGIRILPLRRMKRRVLIYMYRPSRLSSDLSDPKARQILSARGYPSDDPEKCIAELSKRLRKCDTFPHEIGLFLGYPPDDVEGFISGKGDAKCVGTWKVFGNEEDAKRKFAVYDKCTRVYKDAFLRHKSFDRLIVSC